jgi:2-dehydropantoate 2-reductase
MVEITSFRRVLVYGAGALGSVYAAALSRAGLDVALLARGRRLVDLRKHGLVLQNRTTRELALLRLPLVQSLSSDDQYDIVLVIVRKNQVDAILPALGAAHNIPAICFMANAAEGLDNWSRAVGPTRLLLGFPGASGSRQEILIRYVVLPAWLQPTTVGDPDGAATPRLQSLLEIFRRAGFPVAASADMRSWLTSHVAVVSALANAIYFASATFKRSRQLRKRWLSL